MSYDVIVLGAGIVGVSTALHLQERGLKVAILDRREPGLKPPTAMPGSSRKTAMCRWSFPVRLGR